jgi:hypothetical protein
MATSRPTFDPRAKLIEEIVEKSGGVCELTSPAGKVVGRAFNYDRGVIDSLVTYSPTERNLIVDQLRLALSQFYVHLERKKVLYGFDPVRALDLLAPSLEKLSNTKFHESIAQLIARTRDRHLSFHGKAPNGLSVGLGFSVEQCWEAKKAQYIVTRIDSRLTRKHLQVGARVTHWNGVEIDKYLRLNADVFGGGNEAASFARSLAFLTQRPLKEFGPPREESVDLGFSLNGVPYNEHFVWEGFAAAQVTMPSISRNFTGFDGDIQLSHLQHARRVQFAPQSFDAPPPAELGEPRVRGSMTGIGYYGCVTTPHGRFGYIRLLSFRANTGNDLVNAFIPLLKELPRNGLIIDMRGNAGGNITAGERLLQLFTPRRITPSRFQFRVTPATRAMVSGSDNLNVWKKSFEEAFATGEPYSQGYPIEGIDDEANEVGQKYFGPVVLITDALAYSTADMFAAGFIDHSIGRVICTDRNMGAAGGNMWEWDRVRASNPDFYLDLNFRTTFEKEVLSPEVRDEFKKNGVSLSENATVSFGPCQFGGQSWTINDDALTHVIRDLSWQSKSLCVYLAQGRVGLSDLPSGIGLDLTMLRCMRVGKNEGKLIEDLGIEADAIAAGGIEADVVFYQMTLRDITKKNQDLITEASLKLRERTPVYDLQIQPVEKQGRYTLTCRTLKLSSIQVFASERYLTGANVSDAAPTELFLSERFDDLTVEGLDGGKVVARTKITLPAADAVRSHQRNRRLVPRARRSTK